MNRGSVWWVQFDPSIGSEIQKTRPAVIVSNDIANRHLSRVIVIPLTSNTGKVYPGNVLITVSGVQSKALADQIMTADKNRLRSKMGVLSNADMLAVENALKLQLGIK